MQLKLNVKIVYSDLLIVRELHAVNYTLNPQGSTGLLNRNNRGIMLKPVHNFLSYFGRKEANGCASCHITSLQREQTCWLLSF